MNPDSSGRKPTAKRRNSGSEASIGKRGRKHSPSRHILCDCEDCQQDPSPHPETGLPSHGRFFPEDEYKEHRRLLRRRQAARTLLPDSVSNAAASPSTSSPKATKQPEELEAGPIISFLDGLSKSIESARDVVRNHCAFFATQPDESDRPQILTESARRALCQLDSSHPGNRFLLDYKQKLDDARQAADNHSTTANPKISRLCKSIKQSVDREIIRMEEELYNIWLKQSHHRAHERVFDSSAEYLFSLQAFSPVVLACLLLVLVFHLVAGVSMQQSSFLLHALRFILELALSLSTSINVPFILRSIPVDVRTVIKRIELDPKKTVYVCCPKCFCLYWMNPNKRNDYPDRCTHEALGVKCGAKLQRSRRTKNGSTRWEPVREYHTQAMADYLARIYCREDLQQYLQGPPQSSWLGGLLWDIWDGPAIRDIVGPDGNPFMSPSDPDEGRLIFSLNMDGFNPYGNKEAGKKASVGGIYMVCLNLPISIRYDLENMHLVGVIPGPQEPSLDQINHILRPLVDELLLLWKRGIFLSNTRRFPHGQLVRCALGPLVCDLPAARQMSGFASFSSHNFCSICRQTKDNINNLDYRHWIPRTLDQHRAQAEQWKNATTLKEREELVKRNGVRWSELLRLPYWDPSKFTVIDSMHAFYLRLLPHHCRDIWGIDVEFDDGDGITFDPVPNQPSEREMYLAHRTLECDTLSALRKLRKPVLRQLCKDTTTVDFRGRKPKLVERLKDYRIRQGWFTTEGRRIATQPTPHAAPPPPPVVVDFSGYPSDKVPQINTDQDIEDIFANKRNSSIKKLRKLDIITLVRYKVDPLNRPYSYWNTFTTAELCNMINVKRQELGLTDTAGHLLNSSKPKPTRVLGREVLKEIRRDMLHTERPSWVSAPPLYPGEKKWGKLTADQWRTFCLQVAPITLTRLWGNCPPDSTERKRLDNFMELISAIKLATSYQMTPERIEKCEAHFHRYLVTLLELYDVDITPYQHLSLHFGSVLERFGPTHSWRCYVFEQYNLVMRQIPTNMKFGDLEKTLFTKFLEGQMLRSLLRPSSLIGPLQPFVKLFDNFFKPSMTGTGLNNNLPYNDAFKPVEEEITWEPHMSITMPAPHFDLLATWIHNNDETVSGAVSAHAFYRDSVYRLGQTYTTRQESVRNSHIAYSTGSGLDWVPASIVSIFSHTRSRSDRSKKTQTFVVVRKYTLITDCEEDEAFRRYPEVGGRVASCCLEDEIILLSMDQVDSHFISCSFPESGDTEDSDGMMICLPLPKVRGAVYQLS